MEEINYVGHNLPKKLLCSDCGYRLQPHNCIGYAKNNILRYWIIHCPGCKKEVKTNVGVGYDTLPTVVKDCIDKTENKTGMFKVNMRIKTENCKET